jgi:hypothetical protein
MSGDLDPHPMAFRGVFIGAAIGWYMLKAFRWWRVRESADKGGKNHG